MSADLGNPATDRDLADWVAAGKRDANAIEIVWHVEATLQAGGTVESNPFDRVLDRAAFAAWDREFRRIVCRRLDELRARARETDLAPFRNRWGYADP